MGERIDLNSIETEELVKVDGPVSEVEKELEASFLNTDIEIHLTS